MKNPSGRVLRFYFLYLRGKIPRSKGKADLSGMLMGGQFFALEVKRHNEKPTKDSLNISQRFGMAAVSRRSCAVLATRRMFYSRMGLKPFWLKRK
ncbi:MAG: hypothetical protein IPK54_10410 [Dokdonella sp.]|uniref:hypothetical protein n=1 Tax=Dokdonella sp. TaxID=2291710 RepID=UPI0025C321A9|nr:hypothetical protein [Dokdonella sp.]MBK8123944.1 hypothetical protein [Dokdonella sp.]